MRVNWNCRGVEKIVMNCNHAKMAIWSAFESERNCGIKMALVTLIIDFLNFTFLFHKLSITLLADKQQRGCTE